MASNSGFTTTTPSNTSQVALGDDEFRQIKTFMRDWWEDEHYALGGSASSAGEHRLGSARAFVGTLSELSNPQPGKLFFDTGNQRLYAAPSDSSWSHLVGVQVDSINTWTTVQDFERAATDDVGLRTFVTGDTLPRLAVRVGGTLMWGSGSGARDTNLYRAGANHLKTDDKFEPSSLVVGGGNEVSSVKTATLFFPSQTIAGGASSKSTVVVSGITVGDVAFASFGENSQGDDSKTVTMGTECAAGGEVGVWISNSSTGNQTLSDSTVNLVIFDVT